MKKTKIEPVKRQNRTIVKTTGKHASFFDFHCRAMAGERLVIAFMGGSLTWGAGASDPQKTSYRALIAQRLQQVYPKAHFTLIDAAIGGSGAQLAAFRLQRDVLACRPDLFFLDFTLNDGTYQTSPDTLAAYESIVRRMIVEASCPVVQMFLASRFDVEKGHFEKMVRRAAHLTISQKYHTVVGDAILLMQRLYQKQRLNLDKLWPPEHFDNTHPGDAGYVLYAQTAWQALQKAIARKTVCRVPEKMLYDATYMNLMRGRIDFLGHLPQGWRMATPKTSSIAFDFMMSRWLDGLSVAANFTEVDRVKTKSARMAKALRVGFHGSTVLLFGESTLRSGKYRVTIDGQRPADAIVREFDAGRLARACAGTGHLWEVVAEGLVPGEHTMEIQPLYQGPDISEELRLESICVAGGEARLWRLDK